MRRSLGWLLALSGGGIALAGILAALRELITLYAATLEDPLNQPEDFETNIMQGMIRAMLIAAAGVPFLIAGSLMITAARIRRRRARSLARAERLSRRPPS